jgi:hypothetical protein
VTTASSRVVRRLGVAERGVSPLARRSYRFEEYGCERLSELIDVDVTRRRAGQAYATACHGSSHRM